MTLDDRADATVKRLEGVSGYSTTMAVIRKAITEAVQEALQEQQAANEEILTSAVSAERAECARIVRTSRTKTVAAARLTARQKSSR